MLSADRVRSLRAWWLYPCAILAIASVYWLVKGPPPDEHQPDRVVSGRVVDENGDAVAGARVRVKGNRQLVLTDSDGGFDLAFSSDLHGETTITAAKPGFVIAGVSADRAPLVITLAALPSEDFADYQWVDPRPDAAADHNCGNCHGEIFAEWRHDAHARATNGRKFLDLYAGTDAQGRKRGWSLLDEHPTGSSVCTACHAPTVALDDPVYHDLRQASGVAAQGVHCDYCHKVQEAVTANVGLTHGRFAQRLLRPASGQLFFGPLDDVDRDEDSYSPLQKESRFCAACHEGVVFGVHVYSTYSEWLASPAREAGKQCQDCHMAPTGRMTNIAQGAGGIERDPWTLGSHEFLPGGKEAMLKRCLNVEVTAARSDEAWRIDVQVVARNVGHRVPTGFIDRHLLLIVQAYDDAGHEVSFKSGPVLPSAAGELANKPGRLFAKLLTGLDGHGPIPFWRPAAEPDDTRLVPERPERSEFLAPGAARRVRMRLIYRPFWESVVKEKSWEADEIVIFDRTTDLTD